MLRFVVWLCLMGTFLACAATTLAAEPAGKGKANRLAKETSPYLLQHAHNPVDWYPWGEEALAKAKAEKKLIFLSIGYSSCHWCHVMERESFHGRGDRGAAQQALRLHQGRSRGAARHRRDLHDGAAGLHAAGRRRAAAAAGRCRCSSRPRPSRSSAARTFPPATATAKECPASLTVVNKIQEVWTKIARPHSRRRQDDRQVHQGRNGRPPGRRRSSPLDEALVAAVQAALDDQYDPKYGGFGYSRRIRSSPNFPSRPTWSFCSTGLRRGKNERAQEMLVAHARPRCRSAAFATTSAAASIATAPTASGAIPHFEKMLYDNGQLAGVYAAGLRADGPRRFPPHLPMSSATSAPRDDRTPAAASTRRSMPTPKARKASSIAGTKPKSKRSCPPDEYQAVRRHVRPRRRAELRGEILRPAAQPPRWPKSPPG